MKWTKTWPKKSGSYWFYGWRWKRDWFVADKKEDPKLFLVEVKKANNGVFYVTQGHFLYESEGAVGLWLKVIFPELPKDDL
jgi:hypothetical protein